MSKHPALGILALVLIVALLLVGTLVGRERRGTRVQAVTPTPGQAQPTPAVRLEIQPKASRIEPQNGRPTLFVGGTALWTNEADFPVIVEAQDGSFSSGVLMPGESYTLTFAVPGVVTVTVRGVDGDEIWTETIEVWERGVG